MAEQIPAYYTDPRAPRPRGIVPNMIQNGGRTTFVDVSRPSSGRGGSGAEESGRASTSYAANQGLAGPASPSGPAAPAMPGLSAGYVAPQAGGTAPATGGTAPAAGGTAPQSGGMGPTIGSILGGAAGLMMGGPIGMGLGAWGGYKAGQALSGGPATVQTSRAMQPGGAMNASGLFANAMQPSQRVY